MDDVEGEEWCGCEGAGGGGAGTVKGGVEGPEGGRDRLPTLLGEARCWDDAGGGGGSCSRDEGLGTLAGGGETGGDLTVGGGVSLGVSRPSRESRGGGGGEESSFAAIGVTGMGSNRLQSIIRSIGVTKSRPRTREYTFGFQTSLGLFRRGGWKWVGRLASVWAEPAGRGSKGLCRRRRRA